MNILFFCDVYWIPWKIWFVRRGTTPKTSLYMERIEIKFRVIIKPPVLGKRQQAEVNEPRITLYFVQGFSWVVLGELCPWSVLGRTWQHRCVRLAGTMQPSACMYAAETYRLPAPHVFSHPVAVYRGICFGKIQVKETTRRGEPVSQGRGQEHRYQRECCLRELLSV